MLNIKNSPCLLVFPRGNKQGIFIGSDKKVYWCFRRFSHMLSWCSLVSSKNAQSAEHGKHLVFRLFRLFPLEGEVIGDHRDKLRIRGFSLDVRHRIAEELGAFRACVCRLVCCLEYPMFVALFALLYRVSCSGYKPPDPFCTSSNICRTIDERLSASWNIFECLAL